MFGHHRRRYTDVLEELLRGQKTVLATLTRLGAKMAQIDDDIAQLTASVAAERTVVDGAVVLLKGIPAAIQAAVDAALAAGATPAQLQALTDLNTAITQQSTDLADAMVINTPAAARK